MSEECRIGIGFDVHSVVPRPRALMLGGVPIPGDFGLGGHTDGDVVLHAVIDALFGGAGLPDIGEHFPDSDPAVGGMSSSELLARALDEVRGLGWSVNNVDIIIMAERPKLSPYKSAMRSSLAGLLGVTQERIGVKAKSYEGHDAVGQGRAVACHAALTLTRSRTRSP